MKHTKNYMDAKWVVENPEKYDDRDVARANSFIEAYNEGYNKALSLGTVVGQSEQTELPEIGCINSLGCTCKEANGYPLTDCNYWQGN